jgi:hypothetical protein
VPSILNYPDITESILHPSLPILQQPNAHALQLLSAVRSLGCPASVPSTVLVVLQALRRTITLKIVDGRNEVRESDAV